MKTKRRLLRAAVCTMLAACTALAAAPSAGAEEYEGPKIRFKEISCGEDHAMALSENGDLYVWGYGGSQLGTGDSRDRNEPVKIMKHVKQISAGYNISAAITENDELFVWGWSYNLGYSVSGDSNSTPQRLRSDVAFVDLGDGVSAGVYIDNDRELYRWYEDIPVFMAGNVKYSSTNNSGTGYITGKNELKVLGENYCGNLGTGDKWGKVEEPVKILDDAVCVSIGFAHSAAVTSNGDLYTWGRNGYGQLGNGTHDDSYTPQKVDSLSNVRSVCVGNLHTAALLQNGDLYVWGADTKYQLGDGYKVDQPLPFKLLENIKQISTSSYHNSSSSNQTTMALTNDGRILAWGTGYNLGYSANLCEQPTPQEIEVYLFKKLGDVDADDKVTADDALSVLRFSLGLDSIAEDDDRTLPVSDYDKDTKLTSNDALCILRVSLGY